MSQILLIILTHILMLIKLNFMLNINQLLLMRMPFIEQSII